MEGPGPVALDAPRVLSVSAFTAHVRSVLERRFADSWVLGEISNSRTPASGHCYFTLKDESAQLRCVMWRSAVRELPFSLQDGMRVRVRGGVSLYEPRGDLQMIVRRVEADGEGALRRQFEELKGRLAAEGLFDPTRKRGLPTYPTRLGIVTSGDGAALHDILSILARRFPTTEVLTHAVRVQGFGAAEEIAAAIDAFQRMPLSEQPDVMIIGRGGGSIEDLWAFNEEVVARAIYRSTIPIVSAVGHETDVSIADFVADVRAATPSMAAELVVPDRYEVSRRIRLLADRAEACHRSRIEALRRRIHHVVNSWAFNRPLDRLRNHQQRIDDLHERLQRCVIRHIERHRLYRTHLVERLQLLDPRRPMERGYAMVERKGKRVRRADELRRDEIVDLHFIDGRHPVRIQE